MYRNSALNTIYAMQDQKTILLVDDDDDDKLFFQEALQDAQHPVQLFIASNGLDAIHMLSQNPSLVDAVFMDINMPVLNGFDCLDTIKKSSLLQHIPVVMLSTSNHITDMQQALQLGATRFISKSPRYAEFKNSIKNMLDVLFNTTHNNQVH